MSVNTKNKPTTKTFSSVCNNHNKITIERLVQSFENDKLSMGDKINSSDVADSE